MPSHPLHEFEDVVGLTENIACSDSSKILLAKDKSHPKIRVCPPKLLTLSWNWLARYCSGHVEIGISRYLHLVVNYWNIIVGGIPSIFWRKPYDFDKSSAH